MAKASSRARLWGQAALGLQFAAWVYKIYVASTLSFLLQLDTLPTDWAAQEASILRSLVPGPYRWCVANDLHGLRRDFGFAHEFVDLRDTSLAAKFRVVQCEAAKQGGLGLKRWLRRMDRAERRTEEVVLLGRFRSWFATSFCHGLQDAVDKLSSMGISLPAVRLRAVGPLTQPFTRAQSRRADRRMQ